MFPKRIPERRQDAAAELRGFASEVPETRALVDELHAERSLDAAAWKLLGHIPFPAPEPVAMGQPGAGYPLPWSVQTWLPGTTADETDPGDSVSFARDLAGFIRAVRALDTEGLFPVSGFGGGDVVVGDDIAVLPAAVRRIGRLVERIGVMRDMADEDAVYGVFVDVERGHCYVTGMSSSAATSFDTLR